MAGCLTLNKSLALTEPRSLHTQTEEDNREAAVRTSEDEARGTAQGLARSPREAACEEGDSGTGGPTALVP